MALRPQHVAPELLKKVTKALGITALDQWYYVSHYAATQAIGSRALNQCGGTLAGFLRSAYPDHTFDGEKLTPRNHKEKDQQFVEVLIRKLFPNTEIRTKARKAVGIVNPETDAYLEIDFWIPSLKLGIEYQDKHHYGYQWYANESLEHYQERDHIKKASMLRLEYTLITIGYWWDKSIVSLAATIRKYRPDLLQEYDNGDAEPIPVEPPSGHVAEPVIPGVAGIMSPFVPSRDFNPLNWYAGEKYDGIRGVYNPNELKMFSRSGNELSLLSSLLRDIPGMLVEGEIVAGRGNYSKTGAMSHHTPQVAVNWPMFRYIIFDIPDAESGDYTHRYSAVISGLSHPFVFAQSAFRVLVATKTHLTIVADAIISDAGEGVIAQQDAQYEYGRAKSLAKIKVRRDADAQVLGINQSSCTCRLVSGVTANIAFSEDFDPSDLKTGDIVSYFHNGYSQSGLPKRGEVYKVRYDITWMQIISEKAQNVTKRRSLREALGSKSLIGSTTSRHKPGYWNKTKNIRAFFENFAKTSGFDPLVAENWASVLTRSLRTHAGGTGMLKTYGYSLTKALAAAFPELKFGSEGFRTHVTSGHWANATNVRAFFDAFARKAQFDPLITENWYPVRVIAVQTAGGVGLLKAYKNMRKALSFAYPELNFDKGKFRTHAVIGHWTAPQNVRAFFDEFAQTAEFDPLIPENWYLVRASELQKAGGAGLLKAYNKGKALLLAYPELKWDKANL